MQVRITKAQEEDKRWREKNAKLSLEITISLSEKEMELVKKYRDPFIYKQRLEQFSGDNIFTQFKIQEYSGILSKFKLVAHTDAGFTALGNMQELVKGVIDAAKREIDYLASLEKWDGTEIISLD